MNARKILVFWGVILMFSILGCAASTPRLALKKLEPETVKAGDKVLVEVKILDPHHRVHRLVLHVLDYPGYDFPFNDSGQYGDQKAGDGVWTVQVPVPWDAPAQQYAVAIVAYDKHNHKIFVKKKKQRQPLQLEETIFVE